jgi:hypothetical protein
VAENEAKETQVYFSQDDWARVRGVAAVAARDSTRYSINAVAFVPTGRYDLDVVATNGNILVKAVIDVPAESDNLTGELLILAEDILKVAVKKGGGLPVILTIDDGTRNAHKSLDRRGTIRNMWTGAGCFFMAVDSQFPPYNEIIPKLAPEVEADAEPQEQNDDRREYDLDEVKGKGNGNGHGYLIGIRAKLLEKLSKVCREASEYASDEIGLRFTMTDPQRAIRVDFPGGVGVLMPLTLADDFETVEKRRVRKDAERQAEETAKAKAKAAAKEAEDQKLAAAEWDAAESSEHKPQDQEAPADQANGEGTLSPAALPAEAAG